MYQPYEDILSRLGTPFWWDENGVPRYEPFHPSLCSDIYADYAALLTIKCQGCQKHFSVASSWSVINHPHGIHWDENGRNPKPAWGMPTPDTKDSGHFGYGDAPWHTIEYDMTQHQCSGTTMTTDVIAVEQFWGRNLDKVSDWERMPQHEYKRLVP